MNHQKTRKNRLPSRLRLCVYRSAKHIYAQIIDDVKGITLCAASSLNLQKELRTDAEMTRKVHIADQVGRQIAEKAKEKGVTKVFFDRNGYKYHGRVKQLAESARREGLIF
nr:50S ribosomal protein L18 [Chloracidobacterium aggregatum]